jgi:hypothetical protein
VYTIITTAFGPSWKVQLPSSSCSIPMKTGTTYAESLAYALPLDEAGMKEVKATFGFEFRPTLMSCMHFALLTQLDIFTTWVVLTQYQNEPSHIHFAAVKQMVGYLRLHPDLPLIFDHTHFVNTVGCFDLEIYHLDPLKIQFLGPEDFTSQVSNYFMLPMQRTITQWPPWKYLLNTIESNLSFHIPLQK